MNVVGMGVAEIETPALMIDLDAMQRNLAAMAAFARERGLRLRPHAKTHKSAWIARAQIELGAVGVCVQKTSEAQALVAQGLRDVFISNEVIDARKLARIAALAREATLAIAVDSAIGIERLADAMRAADASIDVFVEIDVGHGRCGCAPHDAAALARLLIDRSLRFAGLQAYHGRAQHLRSVAERRAAIDGAALAVRSAQKALATAGIVCPLVSGAGSGSFVLEAESGVWGELQCGSYLFMDRDYADNDVLPGTPRFEHALFVKSQVISRGAEHAVIDAGHKSHSIDSGLPRVWLRDGLDYFNGGDEHGIVRVHDPHGIVRVHDPHGVVRVHDSHAILRSAALPALGEAVWLVPGHCDPTVNLHETMLGVRGGLAHGRVERVIRVDARGCIG